jgi:cytochrome c biogenesis protein CcmG, thiol:disulfide interchange protein DsbE
MSRLVRFVPLVVLLLFVAVVAWRLVLPEDTKIRSKMIGQPVPVFALAPAANGVPGLSSKDLATGRPRLVNVFASWCVPCIAEAPLLMELRRQGIPIDAVAVRDKPVDVAEFLGRHGNPFERVGADPESRVQIALGSSGVPESFIVDGQGIVRYQHMGPIEPGDLPALLREWEQAR